MKNKILSALLVIVLSACVSEFNARITSSDLDILVVEGNIVANTTATFYFSKTFSLDEETPPEDYDNVTVDLVLVGDNGYRSVPATAIGNGAYNLEIGDLDPNVSYAIEFGYEGDVYQSEFSKPLHTPEIDELSFIQRGEGSDVIVRVSTHEDNKEGFCYYLWEYVEDWEIHSNYYVDVFYDPQTKNFYLDPTAPYYYCWKKNRGTEILVGATEAYTENSIVNKHLYSRPAINDRFSYLYAVTVKQQALSKAGYEYYLDKAKANEGMGGIFTPQPSDTEGNIVCLDDKDKKVIGHITVVDNIVEKRFFIPSAEVSRSPERVDCETKTAEQVSDFMEEAGISLDDFYNLGYRPIYYIGEEDFVSGIQYWGLVKCTDCRSVGGMKTKPDFWPNDHK